MFSLLQWSKFAFFPPKLSTINLLHGSVLTQWEISDLTSSFVCKQRSGDTWLMLRKTNEKTKFPIMNPFKEKEKNQA